MAGPAPLRRAGIDGQPADLPIVHDDSANALICSVIIAATDRPATLDACLEAIRRAGDPPDEVIVVDGPPGVGPAAARNAGAMQASGSVLIFVDSDVLVHSDVFSRIRAAFAANPELSALFGSYDDTPSRHGVVSTFRNTLHHYVHQGAPGAATTFWAGLGAVRRDAFIGIDGFDDRRFRVPSVEDIELGLRLGAAGGQIRLDPAILGRHLKHWRVGTMMLTDLLYRGAPWTALMLAHGPRAARLNVRGLHLLAVAAFSAGLAATGLRRPRLAIPLMAGYLALNTRFYRLVLRTGGARAAAAAVLLLATHNATALGSVPLGLIRFGYERRQRPGRAGRRLAGHTVHAAPRTGGVARRRFPRHGERRPATGTAPTLAVHAGDRRT